MNINFQPLSSGRPPTSTARQWLCLVLIALIVGAGPAVERARAALAVIDSSNLAKNAETAATTAKQLIELKNLLETATNIFKGLGAGGGVKSGVFGLDAGGLTSGLGVSYGVSGWNPDVSQLGLPRNLGQPNFGNVQGAVDFVRQGLERVKPTDPFATRATVHQRRQRVAYDAAFDNYGLALFNHNAAAQGSARVNDLAAQANTAAELRQDVQANTKAQLAALEELIALRALLAGILEVQATARIASYDLGYTPQPAPLVGNPFVPFAPPADEEGQGGSSLESVLR